MNTFDNNYTFWFSSATNEIKSNVANSLGSHHYRNPHLLTLTLKTGNKLPLSISPIYVWFDAGMVKISSFVCLVGIGISISSYVVYKIYKQIFPQGITYPTQPLIKSEEIYEKIKPEDRTNDSIISANINEVTNLDKCQNNDIITVQDRPCKKCVTGRVDASHHTDFDSVSERSQRKKPTAFETSVDSGINPDKVPSASGHSTDLGFVSMRSCQSRQQNTIPEETVSNDLARENGDGQDKAGGEWLVWNPNRKTQYDFVDDHCRNRFVITPDELGSSENAPNADPALFANGISASSKQNSNHSSNRCFEGRRASFSGNIPFDHETLRERMHSTPDTLTADLFQNRRANMSLNWDNQEEVLTDTNLIPKKYSKNGSLYFSKLNGEWIGTTEEYDDAAHSSIELQQNGYDSNSDSDKTGESSSQPSSEMFETAKDFLLSTTLNEIEHLQSQLNLITNDVDDLNDRVGHLQKREDPKKAVARRYTLGTTEALTDRKRMLSGNRRIMYKNKKRFLRRISYHGATRRARATRSCDPSSDGHDNIRDDLSDIIIRQGGSAEYMWDYRSDYCGNSCADTKGSLILSIDSALDNLPYENYLSDQLTNDLGGSNTSSVFETNEDADKDNSDSKKDIFNRTFTINAKDPGENKVEGYGKNEIDARARRNLEQIKINVTDDLYIDDDLISPQDDEEKLSWDKLPQDVKGITNQSVLRPQSISICNESKSYYQTPERLILSPPTLKHPGNLHQVLGNENYLANCSRTMTRDRRLNLVNNNISIHLISELLFLSSSDNGPLSPQTSDFLATCLESPARAAAESDVANVRRFMEKIGEAVVNFGSSVVPFNKCSENACSTPIFCEGPIQNGGDGRSRSFLNSLEKISKAFPLWVVKNLDEKIRISGYVEKEFNENSKSEIYQGYKEIVRVTGATSIQLVRKDGFCAIRAVFCQGIISNKLRAFSREFSRSYSKVLQAFDHPNNGFLKNWCFSNRLPYNKGSEMSVVKSCLAFMLDVLNSQEIIHTVSDSTSKEKQLKSLLDSIFNSCPIIDLQLMEAIKLIMVTEAIELFKQFSSSPSQAKSLAWKMFSRKAMQTPEQLYNNRMYYIGDTLALDKTELCFLGHCLKVKVEVLRPGFYHGNSENFVSHYPDEGADQWEKIVLVEESDDSFVLIS